jgi:hypothetical protein
MERPYTCEIDISLPTALCAEQARDVLQVDRELGDAVIKTFYLISPAESHRSMDLNPAGNPGDSDCSVLRV